MTGADPQRRTELAAIHVAKKNLALADDSYRAIVSRFANGRTESAGDMETEERRALLDHFRSLGFERKPKAPRRAGARPLAASKLAGKIRALWLSLYHLGEVESPKEESIAAFAGRMTGVEALQWLGPIEADDVIRALRGWCERAGFLQPDALGVKALNRYRAAAGMPEEGYGFACKVYLIDAQWNRLVAIGAMKYGANAKIGTWLAKNGGVSAPQFLTPSNADRCIEQLARWVRKAKAEAGEQAVQS